MNSKTKVIDVACALIRRNDCYLAVRRSQRMQHPGKWEFPGGKIEPRESPNQCVIREIHEELNLEIKPIEELLSITWHYPDKSVHLIPVVCKIIGGVLRLSEHDQMKWVEMENLKDLDWADADREMLEANHLL